MNYRTVKRSSATELVMNAILNTITTGELKPGDRLPAERELTKMFAVGRSTLREAISALVRMGCLEVIQGKGTFLKKDFEPTRPFSMRLSDLQAAANIFDIIELREILECNSVMLAARRADADDVRRLQEILSNMKANVQDIHTFSEHDFEFHVALAKISGNRMIHEMMSWIVRKVHEEYEKFKPKALFQMDDAISTAGEIISCVVRGEEEEAAHWMHNHLNLVTAEVKRMMPDIKWLTDW
jgi:GntR family transcriptional repressor for pyruvate dehydrogenase complex